MREDAVAEISEEPDEKQVARAAHRVLYDGQCEICQACVSWLKTLDRENKTICLPLSTETLRNVDSRLKMDDCQRQLHVVTPEGEIHVGWDAVACLARLFPSTCVSGVLGQGFPVRHCGRLLYVCIAIEPRSPKMRRSLARHLRRVKPKIAKIIATHAHEEHVGNLNWLSEVTGAPTYVSDMTARFLTPFKKLPWVRATIIGQPPNLKHPFHLLGETVETESGRLQVIATPGHCDDHIVLYDPKEKVLLAGDAFMGSYFATPNP